MDHRAMFLGALFFAGAAGCSAPDEPAPPIRDVTGVDSAQLGVRGHLEREDPGSPDLPMRAVSLRILQRTLATCTPHGDCPEEALRFGRLTWILGYALDPRNGDVLIYGLADPELPPIHVEDFIIALRSSWLKYARLEGGTLMYTHPGCDIRPEPDLVLRLHGVSQQLSASSSPEQTEAAIRHWEQTCGQPQQVSVLGIPFDTRFARVLVQADYDMKRLADGSDRIDLPGLESMMDMEFESVEDALRQRRPVALKAGMNRFWLTPGDQTYEEAEGAVWLRSSPVQVRTHVLGATADGELGDAAGSDTTAEDFAHRFSVLYDKVAELRPIYRELENLFRIYALTQVLRFRNAPGEAGLDLTYLLESYPVASTPVERQVPGRHRVERLRNERQVPGGTEILQLWMPSCGGVEMSIEPSDAHFRKAGSDLLPGVRDGAVGGRLTTPAVAWNVVLSPFRRKAIRYSLELAKLNRPGGPLVVTVEDQGSQYHAFTDRIGDIYQGLNAEALTSQIGERLGAEAEAGGIVYVDMRGFSEDKAKIFILEARRRLGKQNPGYEVRALREMDGQVVKATLFSPGIQMTRRPGPVRPAMMGEKNGYSASVGLAVRVKDTIKEVTLRVWSASKEVVEAFVAKINARFALSDSLPIDIAVMVEQSSREVKKELGERADDLQFEIEIENEFKWRHVADLASARQEGNA